jgi:hypothetical protein
LKVFQSSLGAGITVQKWIVSAAGVASIACAPDAVFLAVRSPDQGGLFRLTLSPTGVGRRFGPIGASDLAVASGRLWTIDHNFTAGAASRLSLFDASTGQPLGSLQLPSGDAKLLVGGTSSVWAVVGDRLVEIRAT